MIQSVDRAVRILKALAGGPGRLGVSELSDRLELAKGTVHGLLRTLQAHGLVEQHPDSDKYQLGPQLLQLSNRYLDLSELRSRSPIPRRSQDAPTKLTGQTLVTPAALSRDLRSSGARVRRREGGGGARRGRGCRADLRSPPPRRSAQSASSAHASASSAAAA